MTWLGILMLATALPADTTARAVTLDEALALARRYAPQAVAAEGSRRTSAAAVRSAYAAFLPNVSLNSGATRQYPSGGGGTRVENGQVITVPDEPWSYSGTLSANVEVFGGGRRFHELGQAKADLRAAEAGVTGDDYGLRLSVKQAFFNVLAARESERAAAAQLEQAEQQLHTVLARVRNKVATRSDSLRSEIQARNAHLAVLDAANSLKVAGASLTRAVGTPYPITAVRDDVAAETVDLDDSALAARAAQGPALRAARARLDAARAARRISWTGYLPSVNASYSRSASGTDGEFGLGADDYQYSGSLRLSLSFPLFNQLQREEQVVRAQVAVDNAEAALRDTELAARLDITQASGSYRVNLERVAALTASVEAAEEDLRVQEQRYAVGGSTLLDVLTSQTQLNQARQDLIRARYDLRVAKAQIEAIIGEDL
jgi:outer membrane protein